MTTTWRVRGTAGEACLSSTALAASSHCMSDSDGTEPHAALLETG